jgi:hypothetical protein
MGITCKMYQNVHVSMVSLCTAVATAAVAQAVVAVPTTVSSVGTLLGQRQELP